MPYFKPLPVWALRFGLATTVIFGTPECQSANPIFIDPCALYTATRYVALGDPSNGVLSGPPAQVAIVVGMDLVSYCGVQASTDLAGLAVDWGDGSAPELVPTGTQRVSPRLTLTHQYFTTGNKTIALRYTDPAKVETPGTPDPRLTVEVTALIKKPPVVGVIPLTALNTAAKEYNLRLSHDGAQLMFLRESGSTTTLLWTPAAADPASVSAAVPVPMAAAPRGKIEFFAVSPNGRWLLTRSTGRTVYPFTAMMEWDSANNQYKPPRAAPIDVRARANWPTANSFNQANQSTLGRYMDLSNDGLKLYVPYPSFNDLTGTVNQLQALQAKVAPNTTGARFRSVAGALYADQLPRLQALQHQVRFWTSGFRTAGAEGTPTAEPIAAYGTQDGAQTNTSRLNVLTLQQTKSFYESIDLLPSGTAHDLDLGSLSADGSMLYFASNRPGGAGLQDLYAMRIDPLWQSEAAQNAILSILYDVDTPGDPNGDGVIDAADLIPTEVAP